MNNSLSQVTSKYIKTMIVAIIAFFFTVVAYTNIIDYASNWQFIQHVLSMDTTFQSPSIIARSVVNVTLQMLAYCFIVMLEMLAAVFCWIGAMRLFLHRKNNERFIQAKSIANIGLAIGIFLYLFCFVTIAGEWFVMWQSKHWNAQPEAAYLVIIIFLSMIYLNQE